VLAAFPRLVKVLKRSVATDIPASRLPSLLEAASDQPVKVTTVGFTPPTYNVGWSSGYPIPDVRKIRSTVHRLTREATVAPTTSADPYGVDGATTTTRASSGSSTSSAKRKPACTTVG
jgi:hypothetical protein